MKDEAVPPPSADAPRPFVSRGGLKLDHALTTFGLHVRGAWCADLGCSTGGFTDCLLRRGAARVWAVDTGYGVLAWSLRNDPRVVVMERANALHAAVPSDVTVRGGVDVVVIDAGWTPQRLVIPAALKWLTPAGKIITLIKPHYEVTAEEKTLLRAGVLADAEAERIARRTIETLSTLGVRVIGSCESPIRGGHATREGEGNREWLALADMMKDEG